jgi:hypothetical protein
MGQSYLIFEELLNGIGTVVKGIVMQDFGVFLISLE